MDDKILCISSNDDKVFNSDLEKFRHSTELGFEIGLKRIPIH